MHKYCYNLSLYNNAWYLYIDRSIRRNAYTYKVFNECVDKKNLNNPITILERIEKQIHLWFYR